MNFLSLVSAFFVCVWDRNAEAGALVGQMKYFARPILDRQEFIYMHFSMTQAGHSASKTELIGLRR